MNALLVCAPRGKRDPLFGTNYTQIKKDTQHYTGSSGSKIRLPFVIQS